MELSGLSQHVNKYTARFDLGFSGQRTWIVLFSKKSAHDVRRIIEIIKRTAFDVSFSTTSGKRSR